MELPQEQVVTIGGKDYRLAAFGIGALSQFAEWAKTKIPDPFDKFAERFGACPESIQKMAFERASKLAETHGTIEDPAVNALMNTVEGAKYVLYLLFKAHQPDMTEADVSRLVDQALLEKGAGFMSDYFQIGIEGERKATRKRK